MNSLGFLNLPNNKSVFVTNNVTIVEGAFLIAYVIAEHQNWKSREWEQQRGDGLPRG